MSVSSASSVSNFRGGFLRASIAASTGATATNFCQGEPITESQMMSAGSIEGETSGLVGATGTGAVGVTGFGGINYWVLYNGAWSCGPAAIFHG